MSSKDVRDKHNNLVKTHGAVPVFTMYFTAWCSIMLLTLASASLSRNNILEKGLGKSHASITKQQAVDAGYAAWLQSGDEVEFRWRDDIADLSKTLSNKSDLLSDAEKRVDSLSNGVKALRDEASERSEEIADLRDKLRASEDKVKKKEEQIRGLLSELSVEADKEVPSPNQPFEDDTARDPDHPVEKLELPIIDVKQGVAPEPEEPEKRSWLDRLFGK